MAVKILSVDDERDLGYCSPSTSGDRYEKVNTSLPLPIMGWRLYRNFWKLLISILSWAILICPRWMDWPCWPRSMNWKIWRWNLLWSLLMEIWTTSTGRIVSRRGMDRGKLPYIPDWIWQLREIVEQILSECFCPVITDRSLALSGRRITGTTDHRFLKVSIYAERQFHFG